MAEHSPPLPARILGAFTPVAVALFCVVLVNLPVSFTGALLPAPLLALAPIYFWSVLRPDLMPPMAVLLLGLTEDLLSGGPAGIWAAGFLAAYAFAHGQREMLASLIGAGAVLGFAAATFLAGATAYLLASLVYWRPAPFGALLLESAVTILFYPAIVLLLERMHRAVVGHARGGD